MSNRINFSFYFLLILGVLIFVLNIKSSVLNGYFFISLNILIIYSFIISFNIIKNSKFIYVKISIASVSFSLLSFDLLTYSFSNLFARFLNRPSTTIENQNLTFKTTKNSKQTNNKNNDKSNNQSK